MTVIDQKVAWNGVDATDIRAVPAWPDQPLTVPRFKRIPRHVAFIPDGNRRWAENHGLCKEQGYAAGLPPGFALYTLCQAVGIKEMTVYGFTTDNTKRPREQTDAFKQSCVNFVEGLIQRNADVLVVGNDASPSFPVSLKRYLTRTPRHDDVMKVNVLVNYDWNWDLSKVIESQSERPLRLISGTGNLLSSIGSSGISRIDTVIRWGGRHRLSGMLPIQSVYADFYSIDELWPDYQPEQFYRALDWYAVQEVTLGG